MHKGKQVSIIIPVKGNCQQFLVSLERDISIITWDGVSDKPSKIEKIGEVDVGTKNRMNDGKCDGVGRLWVGKDNKLSSVYYCNIVFLWLKLGTMGPEPINGHVEPWLGSLYTLTKGKLDTHLTKVGISNGLTFSSDYKKFYYTDTLTGRVDQFDYDIDTGSICKLFVFHQFQTVIWNF